MTHKALRPIIASTSLGGVPAINRSPVDQAKWVGMAGEIAVEHGVTLIGTINIASMVPYHASQMYARNLTAFLTHLFKDGKPNLDSGDEIISATMVTRSGNVVNKLVKDFFKLQ